MKLHEYQAKALLASEGVAVPPGFAAESVEEATAAAEKLGGNFWVVKAMVHAGGRVKGRFQGVASQEELEKVVQGIPVEGGIGGVALCNLFQLFLRCNTLKASFSTSTCVYHGFDNPKVSAQLFSGSSRLFYRFCCKSRRNRYAF
jgi:hypothetical protein